MAGLARRNLGPAIRLLQVVVSWGLGTSRPGLGPGSLGAPSRQPLEMRSLSPGWASERLAGWRSLGSAMRPAPAPDRIKSCYAGWGDDPAARAEGRRFRCIKGW